MTTMDVGIGGEGRSIHLSCGLWGDATEVFVAACEAQERGQAHGTVGASGCWVTMKGSVLRGILQGRGLEGGYKTQSRPHEVREFFEAIKDEGDYGVHAVEV